MNKTQFVEAVAAKAGLKKKDAEAAVNAMTDVIAEALKAGEKVQLIGFGTFGFFSYCLKPLSQLLLCSSCFFLVIVISPSKDYYLCKLSCYFPPCIYLCVSHRLSTSFLLVILHLYYTTNPLICQEVYKNFFYFFYYLNVVHYTTLRHSIVAHLRILI